MSVASVVIPTRNRRERLERAIASVYGQTVSDWEVVVVDDASEDGTSAFLAGIEDGRIRTVRLDEHAERSAARNCGLELVSSPGVLFLDDDDELLPGALESLSVALERRPDACASVGAVIHEADGARRRPSFPTRPMTADVHLELLAGWVGLGGQSLFRTAVLNQVGGWRPGLSVAEDQELWLRVCASGPVAIVPDVVLLHRPHGLEGNAPGWREVERDVVRSHLQTPAGRGARARRAAAARERLRDADIAFNQGAYRTAFADTLRGILTAPFLLASPVIGRGIARGLGNAVVATLLPRAATERLRAARRRRRSASSE
jgi:GT2 family glycosyltransferase